MASAIPYIYVFFSGTLVPGIIFLTITFIPNTYTITIIILLCLADNFCDIGYCGSYAPSLIDIAPNFTGLLSGIATAIANLPYIAVTQIFGYLTAKVRHVSFSNVNYTFLDFIGIIRRVEDSVVHLLSNILYWWCCLCFIRHIKKTTLGIIVDLIFCIWLFKR